VEVISKVERTAVRRSLHRMVRSFTSTMPRRRRTIPGLLEIDGSTAPDLAANNFFEFFEGVFAFGETTNCIAIIRDQRVAMVIDAENPMGRVISVAYYLSPRFRTPGALHLEKAVQMAQLHQQCACLCVVKRLANFIRRFSKWLHGPNEKEISHGRVL